MAETGSTNVDLLAAALEGRAGEGDWLVAERQSAGRGRRGRAWESPAGNLYASTLVSLCPADPPAHLLAFVAAVALAEAVPEAVRLKWPNDLLIEGAKVAGILLERQQDWVVIGFGVNIASAPALPDRRTACLSEHANGLVTADSLLAALAERFAKDLASWRRDPTATLAAWRALGHDEGEALAIALPDGERVEGRFAGLDDTGALRLRLPSGEVRVIHAGDVHLI